METEEYTNNDEDTGLQDNQTDTRTVDDPLD